MWPVAGPDVVGDRFSHGVLLLGFVKAWVVCGAWVAYIRSVGPHLRKRRIRDLTSDAGAVILMLEHAQEPLTDAGTAAFNSRQRVRRPDA